MQPTPNVSIADANGRGASAHLAYQCLLENAVILLLSKQITSQVGSQLPPIKEQSTDNVPPPNPLSFVDQKMVKAYGVTLTNSEGSVRTDSIDLIWERSSILTSKLYQLPGGTVGKRFVFILAKEIDLLASSGQKSEKSSMLGRLMLQKDPKVKKNCRYLKNSNKKTEVMGGRKN